MDDFLVDYLNRDEIKRDKKITFWVKLSLAIIVILLILMFIPMQMVEHKDSSGTITAGVYNPITKFGVAIRATEHVDYDEETGEIYAYYRTDEQEVGFFKIKKEKLHGGEVKVFQLGELQFQNDYGRNKTLGYFEVVIQLFCPLTKFHVHH